MAHIYDFLVNWRNVVEGPRITSYPTAVLIMLDIDKNGQFVGSANIHSTPVSNNMFRIASSCYSYPLCAYYFYWKDDVTTMNLLNVLRNSLNRIGYILPIVCCNLKYDLKYFLSKEAEYFSSNHRDREPVMNYAGQYIIGIASRHLNITLIRSQNVPHPPGLSIGFNYMSTVAPVYFKKTNARVLFAERMHMMYCRTQDIKKTDVLSALLSPFDWLTWTMLLLVFF